MSTVTLEFEDEALDKLIISDLKTQYEGNKMLNCEDKVKLLKALKRVIEYYGGSVDNA